MIDVNKAQELVLSTVRDFGIEEIPLLEGAGRVLRENWYCDRDLPPYDRVTMDGIAISYDGAINQDSLFIQGVAAAGDPQVQLADTAQCIEIMTGAVLPLDTDTVIRYEDISIADGYAHINAAYKKNQNIHWKGEDRKQGELLIPSHTLLSPSEIGVGASIGRTMIKVARQPSIIVVSTGNELVNIDQTPAAHQIRRGNVHRIEAALRGSGISVDIAHIQDDADTTYRTLTEYIHRYDAVILSGGVSKGKYDFLPNALERCGVEKLFHRVAQRPGKPFWFGTHREGATIFALPGNPISSFMCFTIYFHKWLNNCLGLSDRPIRYARLTEDVSFKPDLTYFLEVSLSYNQEGTTLAQPRRGHGSGDLANLLYADAFIQLPRGKETFLAGESYPIFVIR